MYTIFFTSINNISKNFFFSKFAIFLHQYTYPILALVIIASILIARRKFYTFSLLFLSGVLSWLVAGFLKILIHVPRPMIGMGITPLIDQFGYSFPSQHATVFSAIAISMFLVNKKLGIALSILAFIIGISRIVLGVHYPIDVFGGFCLGSIIAFVITRFFKKI